jgi:predicted hotdog family 3-hydroxylacyl-ACP dehydratase/3-hydroxymyristoyl/3-hydroxydecanoyl-(acyl carrier protein) dehydratase
MRSEAQACIGKTEIRRLIPHSGAMCLLDEVTEWDELSICCTSNTHRERTNPLRRGEHFSAIHAFEYGAQAVAIHGGLRAHAAGAVVPPGYLVALRDATMDVATLEQLASPLAVRAKRLFGDSADSVYECQVSAGDIPVAQGRVTIISRGVKSSEAKSAKNGERSETPASITLERHVPADHPSLPGHFPDEPIVPGVVILDEVATALAQWRECLVTGIPFVKFLRPLMPDQIFAISFSSSRGPQIAFQCHVENRVIVEGCFETTRHG